MQAALSADQVLLVDTAARLAEDLGCPPPPQLPTSVDDPGGWRLLTETGFACMHVAESHGGGGAHSADVALVVEQLASSLSCVPFLGQGVLAPELAWRAGAAPDVLEACADGSRRATVAFDASLTSFARLGEPSVAWDTRGATHALALDRDDRLCVVALRSMTGFENRLRGTDVTRWLGVVEPDAMVEVLTGRVDAEVLQRVHAFSLAMLSADLVGVMQSAVDAAVRHVMSRVQFGVAVGTFQAVQHLAADAKVLLEGARSSMWYAAWAADELEPLDALLAARQAKAYSSRVAREVVELQVQLFGGIAITWEERAHVRVRRALLDRVTLGDEFVHEDAIAAQRLEAVV